MAEPKYSSLETLFDATCNSLRTQLGTTDLINHQDIPDKILEIANGIGGKVVKISGVTPTNVRAITFNRPNGATYDMQNVKVAIIYGDNTNDTLSGAGRVVSHVIYDGTSSDESVILYHAILNNSGYVRLKGSATADGPCTIESNETYITCNIDSETDYVLHGIGMYSLIAILDEDSSGTDTSDANATSSDMRLGTSGYVNGLKVDGDVPTRSDIDISVDSGVVNIPAGIYDESVNVTVSTFETWVFELEDGSTVEKEVEVGA